MKMKKTLMSFAALTLSVALAACGSAPTGGEPSVEDPLELKVVVNTGSIFNLPEYLAVSEGFFAEEGLDVEIVPAVDGPTSTAALASGDVDVMTNGQINSARLIAANQKVLAIAQVFKYPTLGWIATDAWAAKQDPAVFSDPSRAAEAFEGARIGVPALGSEAAVSTQVFMAEAGLDPQADVQFEAVAPGAPTIAALEQGQVDIVVTWDPHFSMIAAMPDTEVLLDLRTGEAGSGPVQDQPGSMRWAMADAVEANPAAFEAYARALGKSLEMMRDPEQVDAAAAVWSKVSGVDVELGRQILIDSAVTYSAELDRERSLDALRAYLHLIDDPIATQIDSLTIDEMFWHDGIWND